MGKKSSEDSLAPGQQDESSDEEDAQEEQPSALDNFMAVHGHQVVSIGYDCIEIGDGSFQDIIILQVGYEALQALYSGSSMMMLPFQRYLMLIVQCRTIHLHDGRMTAVESAWIFDPLDRSINEIRYGAFIRQDSSMPALAFSSANQIMATIGQISFNPLPSLVTYAMRDIRIQLYWSLMIRDVPEALNVRLSRLSICDVPEANSADRSTNARSSSPEPLTCGVEEGQADPHNALDEGFGDGASDSSGSERDNDESPD